MKRIALWGALVAVMAALAGSAAAQVQILASAGGWEAFGGRSNDGTKVCGIGTGGSGRYFGIKYFAGSDSFELQLGSPEWNVEDEQPLAIVMEFDANGTWSGTATGFHFRSGMAGLFISVEQNKLAEFLGEFRRAKAFRVEFEDAEMRPWHGNMTGTDRLADAMITCMQNM